VPRRESEKCMSWHYLQGQEAVCWQGDCLVGVPSALLKLIPFAGQSCCVGKEMGCSNTSRSGMTCEPSTGNLGGGLSTLFRGASPAKIFQRPEGEPDLPAVIRDCGVRCAELLATYNLHLCLRKTPQRLGVVDSRKYSKTLTTWGLLHAGECWALGISVRPINAIECGSLLPTPTAQPYGSSQNGCPHDHRKEYAGKGKKSLERMLGGLNHQYREWMLGWPVGWTDLRPLAMGKFRSWLRLHGKR
jgi:hypothetical protein